MILVTFKDSLGFFKISCHFQGFFWVSIRFLSFWRIFKVIFLSFWRICEVILVILKNSFGILEDFSSILRVYFF